MDNLPPNQGSWSGLSHTLERILPEIEELTGRGMDMWLVEWDGE